MWTTQNPEYQEVWLTVRARSTKGKQNFADNNVSAEFDYLLPRNLFPSLDSTRPLGVIAQAEADQTLEIIKYFLPRNILMT